MVRYWAVEEAVKAAENKMGTFREVLAMRREREMAAPMTFPIAQLIAELRERASKVMPQSETGALLTRAAEALARQEELLAEAGEVVEPFAEVDDEGVEDYGDDHKAVLTIGRSTDYWLTLGHFRAAARLSDKLKGE